MTPGQVALAFMSAVTALVLTSCPDPYDPDTGNPGQHGAIDSPMISPPGGTITSAIQVTITGPENTTIYYTLDGSIPTADAYLYAEPITVDATLTITAVATHGDVTSDPSSAEFVYDPDGASSDDPLQDVEIDSSFWGPWRRLDQPESWYMGDSSVAVEGAGIVPRSATPETIELPDRSVSFRTSNMLEVTEGDETYYLYSGYEGPITFSGRVLQIGSPPQSQSRDLAAVAGLSITLRNPGIQTDVHTVTTDLSGRFTVTGAVPETIYEVDVPGEADRTLVKPVHDGEDVGTVPVSESGYRFKAMPCYPGTEPYLIGDGTEYSAAILILNCGSEGSATPLYELTAPAGMTITSEVTNNLQSIPAGGQRSIPLDFSIDSMSHQEQDLVVGVRIIDSNGLAWEDTVSFRAYRDFISVNVNSDTSDLYVNVVPTHGRPASAHNVWRIRLPKSESDYLLVLSGSSADTEMKYSLSLEDEAPPVDGLISPTALEPNDYVEQSTVVGVQEAVLSYLSLNDLDWFRLDVSAPKIVAPASDALVWHQQPRFRWEEVVGAMEYEIEVSGDTSFDTQHLSATVPQGTHEYTVSPMDALPEGQWYWRVRAVHGTGLYGSWNERGLGRADVQCLSTHTRSSAVVVNGGIFCWGQPYDRWGGSDDWATPESSEVDIPATIVDLEMGYYNSIALADTGDVWTSRSSEPVQVATIADVASVSAGQSRFYAVLSNGAIKTWAWGSTDLPTTIDGIANVQKVSADPRVTRMLALTDSGRPYWWGTTMPGESSDIPIELTQIPDASDVVAMNYYAVVQVSSSSFWHFSHDGSTYGWREENRFSNIKQVDTGFGRRESEILILFENGDLYVWDTQTETEPARMTGLPPIEELSAGIYHTLVKAQDGTLWAWGNNSRGQLGNPDVVVYNDTTPVLMPEKVHSPGF